MAAGIEQYQFERIVTVDFRTKTGLLKLTVELFGDGNIILTNEQNVVISAMEYKRMRDRNILHGEPLVFPPAIGKNPFELTLISLADALKGAGDAEVVRVMARSLGLGGVYAEEILQRANIEKTLHCNTLKDADFDAIYGSLKELLSKFLIINWKPNIVLVTGRIRGCCSLQA
jgi:predicted ribosome quality control (RQC) complex YloA/Tae2 family protein